MFGIVSVTILYISSIELESGLATSIIHTHEHTHAHMHRHAHTHAHSMLAPSLESLTTTDCSLNCSETEAAITADVRASIFDVVWLPRNVIPNDLYPLLLFSFSHKTQIQFYTDKFTL